MKRLALLVAVLALVTSVAWAQVDPCDCDWETIVTTGLNDRGWTYEGIDWDNLPVVECPDCTAFTGVDDTIIVPIDTDGFLVMVSDWTDPGPDPEEPDNPCSPQLNDPNNSIGRWCYEGDLVTAGGEMTFSFEGYGLYCNGDPGAGDCFLVCPAGAAPEEGEPAAEGEIDYPPPVTEGAPVAGMLGLGLAAAACALGGAVVLRKKK